MCSSVAKTTLEQLEELDSEIAHLIADALFSFLKNGKESEAENRNS